jgi:UPF0176 protein
MLGCGLIALLTTGCMSSSVARSSPSATTGAPTTAALATPSFATGSTARTRPQSSPAALTASRPTKPPVIVTVTRTQSNVATTVGPPKATLEPSAVTGSCPYLDADVVSYITGQHHGDTRLIAVRPQPICQFYRSDGRWMGSVRVIKAASPQAAVAAVNQHLPIARSQPASYPPGWSGGSMTKGGQTEDADAKSVYGVSKGDIAIIAEENESPSIKARVMATCAIYSLKLQQGEPPNLCVQEG